MDELRGGRQERKGSSGKMGYRAQNKGVIGSCERYIPSLAYWFCLAQPGFKHFTPFLDHVRVDKIAVLYRVPVLG